MQIKKITSNSVICQQRFSNLNIKWIFKKKRDIKWHFKFHNVFYKTWKFFKLFKSFSKKLLLLLLLKYCVLKSWQKSWLLNQDLIFLIWVGLSAWGFVQSLLKWPGSPHLQHSSRHVETAKCIMGKIMLNRF